MVLKMQKKLKKVKLTRAIKMKEIDWSDWLVWLTSLGSFPPDVQSLLDFELERRGGGVKNSKAIFWTQSFACLWPIYVLDDVGILIRC